MKDPVEEMFRFTANELPGNGKIVIAEAFDGEQKQCEFLNGVFYVWEYKNTGKTFTTAEQTKRWRGCTGFDF